MSRTLDKIVKHPTGKTESPAAARDIGMTNTRVTHKHSQIAYFNFRVGGNFTW